MKAIVLDSEGLAFRHDWPEPTASSGEVIVDVVRAGICETDLQLAKGYMGFSGVLGHEFVGIAQSGLHAGRRVVGEINCNCQQCSACRSGLGNHCRHRTVIGIDRRDGAFAERLAVPEHCLHAVPDSVTDEEAVLTEPLAAALQIGEQIDLDSIESAVVLGDGRLALLIAQTLLPHVAELKVVGKHEVKLGRFHRRGMSTVLSQQITAEKVHDLVVDVTGSTSGLSLALELVRPRGTIVMKTTVAAEHQLSLAAVVIDEIQVVGSRCGPFDKALLALESKSVNVDDFVTHRFPLEQATTAFAAARDPNALKVVLGVS